MAKSKKKGVLLASVAPPPNDAAADMLMCLIAKIQDGRNALAAATDQAIADIKTAHEEQDAVFRAQLAGSLQGLRVYCGQERERMTQDGKVKTFAFPNGEVAWRDRPPSVSIRNAEKLIKEIKAKRLRQFLRVKVEINKQAMLASPEKAQTLPGVNIKSAGEDFIVKPNATKLEEVVS